MRSILLWCWLVPLVAMASPEAAEGPARVRIQEGAEGYRLLVNGQPFVVRGAGLVEGSQEELAARGGNSFRTWSTGTDRNRVLAMLDRASRNGLMVAMGIEVARERHGFDYDDAASVRRQRERIREEVRLYRHHPAVLMWAVGNELNLESRNPRVWNAVNDIAVMIHREDPHHPVMTTLAGFDPALAMQIRTRAPALDLIGIQLYGDIVELQDKLAQSRWTGPYVVTEWGPTGHWESPKTTWGAPIEGDASTKAAWLQERYQRHIAPDTRQGLGSYVFLWGDKQERTPTWYGLFLSDGKSTPGVDAMQYLWTGRWPANRAPSITPIRVEGKRAEESLLLRPGDVAVAQVESADAEDDPLSFRWKLLEESTATTVGGDAEQVPPQVGMEASEPGPGKLRFRAPARAGNYRLFVEVDDGNGHAAYANFPFRVEAVGTEDAH